MSIMEKGNSINDFVGILIRPGGFSHVMQLYKDGYIFNDYYADHVSEDILMKLLKKSVFRRRLRELLTEILCMVKETSITDAVFQFCLHYPGKFRKTLLIQLSHMWLCRNQLEVLNQLLDTPEAFYKLLILNGTDERCSTDDFRIFLMENRRFVNDFYIEMMESNGYTFPTEKYDILKSWITSKTDEYERQKKIWGGLHE